MPFLSVLIRLARGLCVSLSVYYTNFWFPWYSLVSSFSVLLNFALVFFPLFLWVYCVSNFLSWKLGLILRLYTFLLESLNAVNVLVHIALVVWHISSLATFINFYAGLFALLGRIFFLCTWLGILFLLVSFYLIALLC